jgi:hypothetical protein
VSVILDEIETPLRSAEQNLKGQVEIEIEIG